MNPVEKFFVVLGYKIKTMPVFVKVLVVALVFILVAFIVLLQSGVFNTLGMTPEERAAYEQEQAEIASAESAAKAAQELIDQENANGYRLFNSPNLTDEEKFAVDFIHACLNKDTATVAEMLYVPDVFSEDSLTQWVDDTGLSVFAQYDDSECAVTVRQENVMDEDGEEVIGTERNANVWFSGAESTIKLTINTANGEMYLTPKVGGIANDVIYEAPVRNMQSESGADMSQYLGEAISSPIPERSSNNVEQNSTWYRFVFPRFPVIETPKFKLVTDIGTFSTTTCTSDNDDSAGVIIADFSPDEINEFNSQAGQTLMAAITAIQNRASDEEVASHLAVSDVVSAFSSSIPTEEMDEEELAQLAQVGTITGVEVYRDEITSGVVPLAYNYHLVGTNTVSMKANIRMTLNSGGECRRCATLLLRKINEHWTVVALSSNILEDVSSLDPEW